MFCHHEAWFWVVPLMCLVGMTLLFLAWTRRGRRGRCFPAWRRGGSGSRIRELEVEIAELKQRLAGSGAGAPYR